MVAISASSAAPPSSSHAGRVRQMSSWLESSRSKLAQVVGAASGQSIAICNSGTHALNAGLHGLLQPGAHVITTEIEHNSVLRPLRAMAGAGQVEASFVASDERGIARVEQAAELLRPNTQMIIVGHASNVTGAVQDLAAWSRLARQCQALLMVDASQTLGYVPIDVQQLGIDVLAAAAHKGLRALPGTGLLYVQPELQNRLRPLIFGGTGRNSEQVDGGQAWPSSVEVGNLNMSGVVSMAVAAGELLSHPQWLSDWKNPFLRLLEGLRDMPAVSMLLDHGLTQRPYVPLVSLLIDGWDVHDFSSVLDASFGIETRAGWHCAAMIHSRLGSQASGGTLRLSSGHSTQLSDIEFTISAFQQILSP